MKRIILLFTMIILVLSCENSIKDETISSDTIIGNWEFLESNYSVEITTNSSQSIPHSKLAGIGAINVSGEENITLSYMVVSGSRGESIHVYDQYPSDTVQYPHYHLTLLDIDPIYYGTFTITDVQGNRITYMPREISFSFDLKTYTLIMDFVQFYQYNSNTGSIDSSHVLSISGTFQNRITTISPETPTCIVMDSNPDGFLYGYDLIFKEGGEWIGTVDSSETYGFWDTTGNWLSIIEEKYHSDSMYSDTIEYNYSLSKDTLTLVNDDECYSDGYLIWCLDTPDFVKYFDDGSLKNTRHLKTRIFVKRSKN